MRDYLDGGLTQTLQLNGLELYQVWFVPTGYGKMNQLDITLCIAGHTVLIECKAPGEWLTPRQILTAANAYKAGATVFIISGDEGLDAFKRWVRKNVCNWHA